MSVLDPLELVGQVIDHRYAIESVAGAGGTAIVYRAMHTAWHRPVALKVVRALQDVSEDHRRHLFHQLEQEAGLLASLSERCSAIVQARDIGYLTTPSGTWLPYIVLEWLEGETLEAILERESIEGTPPRSLEAAMRLLEPVAHALDLAHRAGVAHRDVKPANLFVLTEQAADDGVVVKVLDFGIAKVVADAFARDGGFTRTLGTFTAFTPAYAAPEQFSREHGATGPWTDVFALGLVLAELTTGEPPLAGREVSELAASSMSERRPALGRRGSPVSAEVAAVFSRAVAVRIEDRFATAGALWRALQLATGLPTARTSESPLSAAPLVVGSAASAAPRERELITQVEVAPPAVVRETADRTRVWKGIALVAIAAAGVLGIRPASWGGADSGLASAAVPSPPLAVSAAPAAAPPPLACPADMVRIEGGKFFMGSDDPDVLELERPAHKVALTTFCIDRTEVTVAAFKTCSDAGECKRAAITNAWPEMTRKDHTTYDPLCNGAEPETRAQHPINCVDHGTAESYCAAVGKRLPSEAEWEYAARGPDGRIYPWGDEPPSAAFLNACGTECARWGTGHGAKLGAMHGGDDGWPTTAPVGSFPLGASRFGVEDVVGNVWEWVADWYGPYAAAESAQPAGPSDGSERVIRGGAWNGSHADWVRPTFRYKNVPSARSHGIGFRCASRPE